jgi:hypothetical protein
VWARKGAHTGPLATRKGPLVPVTTAGLTIRTSGSTVTLTLTGGKPSGPVLFQLPAFVGNITHASAGTVDSKTGTVTLAATVRSVTVQLSHPEPPLADRAAARGNFCNIDQFRGNWVSEV